MSIFSFHWEEYAKGNVMIVGFAVAGHCMDEKRPASLSTLMLWNNRVIIDKDFPIKSQSHVHAK